MVKILAFLVLGVALIQCVSQQEKLAEPLLGDWELTEFRCESGDYEKAGKRLRQFYKTGGNYRTMQIQQDKILTTNIQGAYRSTPCKVVMESQITKWAESEMLFGGTKMTKSSDSGTVCQGSQTSGGGKRLYKLIGGELIMLSTNPVVRINPKASRQICRTGKAAMMVYRRK